MLAMARVREYSPMMVRGPGCTVPQTLGVLRDALGRSALSRVMAELGKDLTKIAIHDLPQRIGGAIQL